MGNTDEIRKRINKKYGQVLWIYILIIFVAVIGWIYLCRFLLRNQECPLKWFLAILLLGETVLAGLVGVAQLYKARADCQYGDMGIYMVCFIDIVLWLIYLICYIIFGIIPAKFLTVLLGILLDVVLVLVILAAFCFLYFRVSDFCQLSISCKNLDCSMLVIQGHNQRVECYNNMNCEIAEIGRAIGRKVDEYDIDIIDMEVPNLNCSEIHIFSSSYIVNTYMLKVNQICGNLKKVRKEIEKQNQYIDTILAKKEKLLVEVRRSVDKMKNLELPETLRKGFKEDVELGYEKLSEKDKIEKKIKSIKRSI